jgi:L-malate glycosyltransferase
MRVLHVISGDLWAGAEVQAYTLLTTLQGESGIQVAAALMNDGELARRLRERNIPVTLFPEQRLNALQILSGLRRLMLDWQPHVVHTHRTKENILGSIANTLSRNVASVRTVHGANEHPPRGWRRLHKKLLHGLDNFCGRYLQHRIIAVSRDLSQKLAGQFPADKLVVIENGVDVEAVRMQVHPVEFREQEPAARHIGIVGRLVAVKRVDLFLQMARLLVELEPARQWRFHIFGDGPLRATLAAQAVALNLSDIAVFHGHRHDIVACLAALDVVVICSDHEGLPMTLLEALAVGTPVAAHAVGGMTQLLSDSGGGLLVNRHDAAAYANTVQALLDRNDGPTPPCRPPPGAALPSSASDNARNVKAVYQSLARNPSA